MMMIKKSFDIVFRKCLVGKRDKRRFSENIRRNNRKANGIHSKNCKTAHITQNIVKGKRVECFWLTAQMKTLLKAQQAQAVTS